MTVAEHPLSIPDAGSETETPTEGDERRWWILGRETPYWVRAAGLVVPGAGMGNVGAPATGAVMGALPVARAGVGSAVNDTAREVGGALGIAVMGSLLAAGYRSGVGDAVAAAHLDAPATHAVQQSTGAALHEAAGLGGDAGPALALAAGDAYIDAMGVALLVAAGGLVAGAALVRRFLAVGDR
jgi:MFS transporter, DHA2 family, multidrug resistance protein